MKNVNIMLEDLKKIIGITNHKLWVTHRESGTRQSILTAYETLPHLFYRLVLLEWKHIRHIIQCLDILTAFLIISWYIITFNSWTAINNISIAYCLTNARSVKIFCPNFNKLRIRNVLCTQINSISINFGVPSKMWFLERNTEY